MSQDNPSLHTLLLLGNCHRSTIVTYRLGHVGAAAAEGSNYSFQFLLMWVYYEYIGWIFFFNFLPCAHDSPTLASQELG